MSNIGNAKTAESSSKPFNSSVHRPPPQLSPPTSSAGTVVTANVSTSTPERRHSPQSNPSSHRNSHSATPRATKSHKWDQHQYKDRSRQAGGEETQGGGGGPSPINGLVNAYLATTHRRRHHPSYPHANHHHRHRHGSPQQQPPSDSADSTSRQSTGASSLHREEDGGAGTSRQEGMKKEKSDRRRHTMENAQAPLGMMDRSQGIAGKRKRSRQKSSEEVAHRSSPSAINNTNNKNNNKNTNMKHHNRNENDRLNTILSARQMNGGDAAAVISPHGRLDRNTKRGRRRAKKEVRPFGDEGIATPAAVRHHAIQGGARGAGGEPGKWRTDALLTSRTRPAHPHLLLSNGSPAAAKQKWNIHAAMRGGRRGARRREGNLYHGLLPAHNKKKGRRGGDEEDDAESAVAALLYATASWNRRRNRNSRRSGVMSSLPSTTTKSARASYPTSSGGTNDSMGAALSLGSSSSASRSNGLSASQQHMRANLGTLKAVLDILLRTSLTEMREAEMTAWLEQTAVWLSNEESRQLESQREASPSHAAHLDIGYGGSYFPYMQVNADAAANAALLGKIYFRILAVLQTMPWWRLLDVGSSTSSSPDTVLRVWGVPTTTTAGSREVEASPAPNPLFGVPFQDSLDASLDHSINHTNNNNMNNINNISTMRGNTVIPPSVSTPYQGWLCDAASPAASANVIAVDSPLLQHRQEVLLRSQYAVQIAFERLCVVCMSRSAHCANGAVEALMRPFAVRSPSGRDGVRRVIPADSMLRVLNRIAKDQHILEQQQQQQQQQQSASSSLSFSFSCSSTPAMAPMSSATTTRHGRGGSLVREIFTQAIRHWMPKLKWPEVWHHVASTAMWLHLALEETIPLREDEEDEEDDDDDDDENTDDDDDDDDDDESAQCSSSESDQDEEGVEEPQAMREDEVDEVGVKKETADEENGVEGAGPVMTAHPSPSSLAAPAMPLSSLCNNALSVENAVQELVDVFHFEAPYYHPTDDEEDEAVEEEEEKSSKGRRSTRREEELTDYRQRCRRYLENLETSPSNTRGVNYAKAHGNLILQMLLERFLMMELALEPATVLPGAAAATSSVGMIPSTGAVGGTAAPAAGAASSDVTEEDIHNYFFSPPTSPTSIMSPANFFFSTDTMSAPTADRAPTMASSGLTKCAVTFPLSAPLLRSCSTVHHASSSHSAPGSPVHPYSTRQSLARRSGGGHICASDDLPGVSRPPPIPPAMASLFAYPTCIPLQALHHALWSKPLAEGGASAVPDALKALFTLSTSTTIDCLEPCVSLLYARLRQDMLRIIAHFERQHPTKSHDKERSTWRWSQHSNHNNNNSHHPSAAATTIDPSALRSPSLSPSPAAMRSSAPNFPSWWPYLVQFHFTVLRQVGGPVCLAYLMPSLLQVYASRVEDWVHDTAAVEGAAIKKQEEIEEETTAITTAAEKGADQGEDEESPQQRSILLWQHQLVRQTLQLEEALNIMHRLISLVLRGYYMPTPAMLRTGSHSPAIGGGGGGDSTQGGRTLAAASAAGPAPIRMAGASTVGGAAAGGDGTAITVPLTDRTKLAHYLYPLFKFFQLHHWHRVQDEQRRGLAEPNALATAGVGSSGGGSTRTSTTVSGGAASASTTTTTTRGAVPPVTKTAAEVLLRRLVKWCRVHIPQETKGSSSVNNAGATSVGATSPPNVSPSPHPLSYPPTASAVLAGIIWAQTMAIASAMDAAVSLSSQQQQQQQQQRQRRREKLLKDKENNTKSSAEEYGRRSNNGDDDDEDNHNDDEDKGENTEAPPYWTMMGALWTDPALEPLIRYYQPSFNHTATESSASEQESSNANTTMWLDFCQMEQDGLIRLTLLECCPWPVCDYVH